MPKDKVSIEIEIKKIGEGLKLVQREMKDLSDTVKREGSEIRADAERTHRSFKMHWVAITAILAGTGYAAIKAGKSFVEAAGEAETFATQLVALTGIKAKEWFKDLTEFGAKTPHMTQDVIQSFIMLRSIGLEPTMKMIKTLGDTAFLFGRQMTDVANAMVSTLAMTVRMLGVEMDRTGKQAKLTSGDIVIFVENTAEGIRKGLLEIWEKRFGGAMEIAEKTWRGTVALFWSGVWEMRAALGDILLPGLKIIVQQLTNIIFRIRDWAKTHREAAQDITKNGILVIIEGLEKVVVATGYITDAWYYLRRFIVGSRIFFADFFRAVTGMAKDFLEAFNFEGMFNKQIEALDRIERTWASVALSQTMKSDELVSKHEAVQKAFETIRTEIQKLGKEAEKQWPELTNLIDLLSGAAGPPAAPKAAAPTARSREMSEIEVAERIAAIRKRLGERVAREQRELLEKQIRLGKDLIDSEHLSAEERELIWEQYKNVRIKQINEEMEAMELAGVSSEMIVAYQKDALAELETAHKRTTAEIGHAWEDLRGDLQWSLEAGFFDVFKGGITDIGDAFKQFCNMLYESFARTVSKMITEWLIFKAATQIGGALGGMFGGGGGPELAMAQYGAILNEPTLGFGLKSGRRWLFGEAGPEAVVPARGFSMTRELQQNIFIVDDREKIKGMTPNDTLIVVSEDIQKDGIIRKTIKRFI